MAREPDVVTMTVPLWLWTAMTQAYLASKTPEPQQGSGEYAVQEYRPDTDPAVVLSGLEIVHDRVPPGYEPRGSAAKKRAAAR